MTVNPIRTADDVLGELAQRGPTSLLVEVSNRCNHACVHCYQAHGVREELDLEQLAAIFGDFRRAGGFIVTVSGGEATLRDDIVEILRRAKSLGLATVLCTNAYRMTPELASQLAAAGVWKVEVSVYSDDPEEHDAVTAVPGSWHRTTDGVRMLRGAGLNVKVKLTPMRGTTVSFERATALADELGCSLLVGTQMMPREDGNDAPLRLVRPPSEVADMFRNGPHPSLEDRLRAAPCGVGASALTVQSDGTILPCSNLSVPLGRAAAEADGGISAAHQSEEARFLRAVTWLDFHGCRDCDLVPWCSRCYATAAVETGDLLGPYPSACSVAVARYQRARPEAAVLRPSLQCGPGRDGSVGPYRVTSSGLEPIPDAKTPEDERLAKKFPWAASFPTVRAGNPPQLVRLRASREAEALDAGPRRG